MMKLFKVSKGVWSFEKWEGSEQGQQVKAEEFCGDVAASPSAGDDCGIAPYCV